MLDKDKSEVIDPTAPPDDMRDKPDYWRKWIAAAIKAKEKHDILVKDAEAEYHQDCGSLESEVKPSFYPIYFQSCKSLEPAYFAKLPKLRARRRFDIDDELANTMALQCERGAEYLMESCDFFAAMECGVSNFIHGSIATTQLIYTADMIQQAVRKALIATPDGQYTTEKGEPYDGEVMMDDGGLFCTHTEEVATNQKIGIIPAIYDEVLHTPGAKTESEITEKAFKFRLNYAEAVQKFCMKEDGTIDYLMAEELPWCTNSAYANKDNDVEKNDAPGKYLEGWECWSLPNKMVYWVAEKYTQFLTKPKPDPYKLRGFFPAPKYIIDSKPSKSMYPTPIYKHLKPTINELHKMYHKVFSLIQAIRRRCLVDGSHPELLAAIEDLGDQEFITVQGLQKIVESAGGSIANLIWFVPVQELVTAITELNALEEQFKNNFYSWFGLPDILQGNSDPNETAEATNIKAGAAKDRFTLNKRRIQTLARDSIELMLDLAFQVFDETKWKSICGFDYMKPEHQVKFSEALARNQSDEERLVRIDIETDSTSFMDQQQELSKRRMISETILSGLSTIAGIQNPSMQPIAVDLLLSTVAGMGGSTDYEDQIKKAVAGLQEMKDAPQPPPPPDYEQMKIQLKGQELQLKNQKDMRELDQKEYKIGMEQQKLEAESARAAVESQLNELLVQVEQLKLALEKRKVDIAEAEMMAEETRLSRQVDNEGKIGALQAIQGAGQEKSAAQPMAITINLPDLEAAKKPKRRKVTPIRNESGDIVSAHFEDLVDG